MRLSNYFKIAIAATFFLAALFLYLWNASGEIAKKDLTYHAPLDFGNFWGSQSASGLQTSEEGPITSYTYQGPTQTVPGNSKLVQVEVLVRDSPQAGGVQINRVDFNGQEIPLQPRDIYGNRGTGSFQVSPGKYKLRWVAQKDKIFWPRTVTREEEVNIDPRDLWIQIEIIGEEASIR